MKIIALFLIALAATCTLAGCGQDDDDSADSTAPATLAATTSITAAAPSATATVPIGSAIDLTRLPMGDGKYSSTPKVGYVTSCETSFPSNAPGAQVNGSWINGDGTWNKSKKLAVLGENYHPEATFSVAIVGVNRILKTNDLPQPSIGYTGNFPVSRDDPAYQIDRNPGSPQALDLTYTIPANPTVASSPTCTALGAVGVLNDGVVLFNALDAGGRDAGAHEVLDSCAGHPAMTEYHHHDLDTCLEDAQDATGHSVLMGYAFDGFGLFGNFGENGVALTNADLDECHGHTHEIEWDGKRVVMYHYHATAEFPYSIGCYRGTPTVAGSDPHGG